MAESPLRLPLMTYEPLALQHTHSLRTPRTLAHLWPTRPLNCGALIFFVILSILFIKFANYNLESFSSPTPQACPCTCFLAALHLQNPSSFHEHLLHSKTLPFFHQKCFAVTPGFVSHMYVMIKFHIYDDSVYRNQCHKLYYINK
jgi:hypothetical protein